MGLRSALARGAGTSIWVAEIGIVTQPADEVEALVGEPSTKLRTGK